MTQNENNNLCRAAIYCRLSLDDDVKEEKEESSSIQSQKAMLEYYVKSKGWVIAGVYVDDGYTGLNVNRPSFKRLIKDIENKKIDVVITKDLSRLGRNYLQTGYYIEEFFPKNNVRYIALNDNVDTFKNDNDFTPFRNILNEFYSKDISKKIRSTYITKAKQGQFTGCLAPIGYKKDKNDPHKLIIDNDTAWIVEKIFLLAATGQGVQAIRSLLYLEKIPAPTYWNRIKGLRNKVTKYEKTMVDGQFLWDLSTLKDLIKNPVYIGNMASQKANSQFKIGWLSDKPPDEWIIVENTHEAIVSKDIYDLANEHLKSRKRSYKTGEESIFSGLLKCPDCGKTLSIGINNSKNKERMYVCNTYRKLGKNFCTQHKIFYDTLYNLVLEDIRKNAKLALENKELIIKELQNLKKEDESRKNSIDEQYLIMRIKEDNKRLNELNIKIEKLYDDRLSDRINEDNFQRILKNTQIEQDNLKKNLKNNKDKINKENKKEIDFEKWVELIKKHSNIEKLDKKILNELISKIYVHEKEEINGEIVQRIEIFYNFLQDTKNLNLIHQR